MSCHHKVHTYVVQNSSQLLRTIANHQIYSWPHISFLLIIHFHLPLNILSSSSSDTQQVHLPPEFHTCRKPIGRSHIKFIFWAGKSVNNVSKNKQTSASKKATTTANRQSKFREEKKNCGPLLCSYRGTATNYVKVPPAVEHGRSESGSSINRSKQHT